MIASPTHLADKALNIARQEDSVKTSSLNITSAAPAPTTSTINVASSTSGIPLPPPLPPSAPPLPSTSLFAKAASSKVEEASEPKKTVEKLGLFSKEIVAKIETTKLRSEPLAQASRSRVVVVEELPPVASLSQSPSDREVSVELREDVEVASLASLSRAGSIVEIRNDSATLSGSDLVGAESIIQPAGETQAREQGAHLGSQSEVVAEEPLNISRQTSLDGTNQYSTDALSINSEGAGIDGKSLETSRLIGEVAELAKTREVISGDLISNMTSQIEASQQAAMMPHHLIKNRLFGLNHYMPLVAVAAGSEESHVIKYGVWGSGSVVSSKQSARAHIAAYKGSVVATTIGADAEISDGNLIGIAYSNVRSSLRFNERFGKSRINSHILSLYYQRELGNDLSAQLMGSLSGSEIRNKVNIEKKGKSYAGSCGVEGDISYRHFFGNGMQLISTMGARYHYIIGGLYKEQDTNSGYMLKVLGKPESMVTGLIGGRLIFKEIALGKRYQIVPNLQASFEKNLTGSKRVVVGTIASNARTGGEVRVEIPKALKQGYNLGAGIAVVSKMLKLELDYNYHIQKAYSSHEGVMKLKVSF